MIKWKDAFILAYAGLIFVYKIANKKPLTNLELFILVVSTITLLFMITLP